jgi:uncharacterized protein involved in exopolysaccharide biosynthesis
MANSKEVNGADPAPGKNGNGSIVLDDFAEGSGVFRSYFVLLALRHRRLLIAASLCSMAAMFVLTYFIMHPKFQATAIIRPVGQNPNSIGGLLQSAGMVNQSFAGVGIDSDIGTNVHDPDELVTILNSYTFTTGVIESENLGPLLSKGGRSLWSLLHWLLPSGASHGPDSPMWRYYLAMSSRFTCDSSVRTGNITLNFIDKDPDFARRVLHLYIDRLRDSLRKHDVVYNKEAAQSLEQAAASASDPMLRDALYELAARQIQKINTAKANADFAFRVLEKPYVPPDKVRPWVVLDTLFAGIAIPMLIFAGLVIADWTPRIARELADAASESERMPAGIAVARRNRSTPGPEDDRPYAG